MCAPFPCRDENQKPLAQFQKYHVEKKSIFKSVSSFHHSGFKYEMTHVDIQTPP